jgi:hypothetical protein
MKINTNDLIEISSEIVSTIEGALGIGIYYDDIVDIVSELLIKKLELEVLTD